MDSNNLPYFLLREPDEFEQNSSRFLWDTRRNALVLAQNQELRLPAANIPASIAAWSAAKPLVFDKFGQLCRIHSDGKHLEYNAGRGYRPLLDGDLQAVNAVVGDFTDLALGAEGRLAAGYSDTAGNQHGLLVFHLAKRWQVATALPERPLRVCVAGDKTLWCISANWLIQCSGEPLPHSYIPRRDRFEPVAINPHPLRIIRQIPLGEFLQNDDSPLALCSDEQQLYLLVYKAGGASNGLQVIVTLPLAGKPINSKRYEISEVPFAIDMGLVSPGRLALLPLKEAGDSQYLKRDCAVVQLLWHKASRHTPARGEARLIRERYPMLSQAVPRFFASGDGVLRYQAEVDLDSEEAALGFSVRPRELHALQRPRYFSAAMATLLQELDSGQPNLIWHRLYLEGSIPPGCKLRIYAKTYNSAEERAKAAFIAQPDWVWCSHRSDQPFGKGLLEAKRNERGLFELLLQSDRGPVRRMSGRYLQLRVQMESDGRHTPAIHALKIYYPRFSYQEVYLPEHFRQEQAADPTLDALPANGADIRERMLATFEAVWTPLEGHIASAELLIHPAFTPSQHLPWLGELLGQSLPEHWPEQRRRRWLAQTGELQAWRGSLYGIQLALDIITDGAVARGQVVLVENFRLRRTMATILGVSMDDETHPLTLGTGMSGNSIVGDSLILAEKDQRDFLALFAPELADNVKDKKIVANFFDRYANQITVLLHGDARRLKEVVQAALQQQMPAHLVWRLLETDHPFVLGLSPLLGVNSFLERQPPARPVILDDTYLGREGLLKNPAAFSPRDVHSQMIS
ncbi:MAG TPA: phage tail protein [Cellvibrio sp.]|nr:phage tail protein [Cellvibrio sp.]